MTSDGCHELPCPRPRHDLFAAAARADVAAVRRHLADRPAGASVTGGPHGWSPLLYQAYARHDPHVGRPATLETARLLLDAGADPDDGQTLYNRMFGSNDDHLVLLFEYGLGRDTRGPWHRLLGESLESPAEMLRSLLARAIAHDQRRRVAVLATAGFDVNALGRSDIPGNEPWHTALHVAAENGNLTLARTLLELGADPNIPDKHYQSTPLGRARHFGQPALAELLEPRTQLA